MPVNIPKTVLTLPPTKFRLEAACAVAGARAGEITTDHGTIQTPIFMPVGTAGTVKGVHILPGAPRRCESPDNTWQHLPPLSPPRYGGYIAGRAACTVSMAGTAHILTDSGGFQVFSLSANRKLTEEGAHFRSHIDGSRHLFTPRTWSISSAP